MNHLKRFQQGDQVQYSGGKYKDLHGALGEVVAHVAGSDCLAVVSFGKEAYILDENRCLVPFQAKAKSLLGEEQKPSGPEVQKRRPGGGGKRRNDQDASE